MPFSILSPQENVRLLELPPELVKIIEDKTDRKIQSGTYPTSHLYKQAFGGRIQLKSAPTDDSSTTTKPKNQYLHLCTESHVWQVRQVSTSNSVYVLAPARPNAAAEDPSLSRPGVAAFAQPTSTLELLPSPFTPAEIDATLHRLLPTHRARAPYPDDDDDLEPIPTSAFTDDASLDAALPFPHIAIAQAKRRCFVFTAHNGGSYVPSPQLLLAAWRQFVAYADSQKVNVATMDVLYMHKITTLMALDEGTLLPAVVEAIALEFWDDGQLKAEVRKDLELERAAGRFEGPLKERDVTRFVGELLVRCAGNSGIRREALIDEWQNLVPRQWWEWCKVEELADTCAGGDGGSKVMWRGKGLEESGKEAAKAVEKESASASSTPGKRNWHEKFAAQRKR